MAGKYINLGCSKTICETNLYHFSSHNLRHVNIIWDFVFSIIIIIQMLFSNTHLGNNILFYPNHIVQLKLFLLMAFIWHCVIKQIIKNIMTLSLYMKVVVFNLMKKKMLEIYFTKCHYLSKGTFIATKAIAVQKPVLRHSVKYFLPVIRQCFT